MPFTMPNFPILTPEQANPFAAALSSGISAFGKTQDFRKAQQDIQKAIYQNMLEKERSQYYPRLAKAETLETEAKPGLTSAQAGLYGQQASQAAIEAQKAKQLMQILSMWMARQRQQGGALNGGGGGSILPGGNMQAPRINMIGSNAASTPSQSAVNNVGGGYTPIPTEGGINQGYASSSNISSQQPSAQTTQQGGASTLADYALSSIVSHQLGLPAPHFIKDPATGIEYAITGVGDKIPVFQGLSAEQEAFQSGLGKANSEAYSDLSNQIASLQSQDIAYDQLVEGLNNPEFFNTTGPVRSYLLSWGAGSKQKQELLGKLQAASGEIELAVPAMLKGSFAKFEDKLIRDTKPNPTDTPYAFMGKLKAQMVIKNILKSRAQIAADLLLKGVPKHKAIQEAAKQTPFEPHKKQIDKLIDPVIPVINKKTGQTEKMKLSEARERKIKGV